MYSKQRGPSLLSAQTVNGFSEVRDRADLTEGRPFLEIVKYISTHNLPHIVKKIMTSLGEVIEKTYSPELRFSIQGVKLRERAMELFEELIELRLVDDDDRLTKCGVKASDIRVSFKQLLKGGAEVLTDAKNPLTQLLNAANAKRLTQALQEKKDANVKISFSYPPNAIEALAEGQGMIHLSIRSYGEEGDRKLLIGVNEVWDTEHRKEPVVSVLFKQFPEFVGTPIVHGHYHDDHRFQFLFDVYDLIPENVTDILAAFAKEAWESRPEAANQEGVHTTSVGLYLSTLQEIAPSLRLEFSTHW